MTNTFFLIKYRPTNYRREELSYSTCALVPCDDEGQVIETIVNAEVDNYEQTHRAYTAEPSDWEYTIIHGENYVDWDNWNSGDEADLLADLINTAKGGAKKKIELLEAEKHKKRTAEMQQAASVAAKAEIDQLQRLAQKHGVQVVFK